MILRVLFDGWSLCRDPLSSAALHLLDLLPFLPVDCEAVVAFPSEPPAWWDEDIEITVLPTANSDYGRLLWEQRRLPRLAAALHAVLHLPAGGGPLFATSPAVSSGLEQVEGRGFSGRVRTAMNRGGATRTHRLLPEDVPADPQNPAHRLVPVVHPRFVPRNTFLPPTIPGAPEIPASFILCHPGPSERALRHALDVWTWAAGPIGDVHPLLLLHLSPAQERLLLSLTGPMNLRDTVIPYPEIPPTEVQKLYQSASALLVPVEGPLWGNPMRYGMACGKPVAGVETARTSAIAGPGAYLVPPEDVRRTGAALLAVIVRDDTRKQVVDAALRRAHGWSGERMRAQLGEIYRAALRDR